LILFLSEENESCRSLQDLWMKLEIDEDDCKAALKFWTSKRILRELNDVATGDIVYEIIEDQQHVEEVEDSAFDRVSNSRCGCGGIGWMVMKN
jgi:hypothetical protein